MKTLRFSASGTVLVSDEDFAKLWLSDPHMQTTWAARIQSYIGDAPLLEGRENGVRVVLAVVDDKPVNQRMQLVA